MKISIEEINEDYCTDTMIENLEIKITKISPNFVEGIMPVTNKIKQPFDAVHGGANCTLAETLANIGGSLNLIDPAKYVVGQSMNINHVKSVRTGYVKGIAKPRHIGNKTHVWGVETFNALDELTSTSVVTLAVICNRSKKECVE